MKSKKKTILKRLMIFSIVSMFFITAIQLSVVSTSNINENVSKKDRFVFQKIENFQPNKIQKNSEFGINQNIGTLETDTLIFGGNDESVIQNPTITDNNGQNILIGFEFSLDWLTPADPYFKYSTDGGVTWLPEDSASGWGLSDAGYYSILPTIDYSGDRSGFGSMLPFDQNNWVTFNFPDIADLDYGDSWVANSWTADVMMSEWHSVDVCGVNSQYAPSEEAYGIAIWTGDTVDDLENGLWFGWEINEGTELVVYPDEGETVYDFEADQAVNDIDLSTGKYYQGFYRFNDESQEQYPDGVFLRGAQLDGTEDWVNSWETLVHITGATNPDVKADNGNCFLVYEINGGIGCHYSNNNGVSFNNVNIANNGNYPSVSATGENVVVAYIKNGNIYNSISDDGGATWIESSVPTNDLDNSAIEQKHCVDVSSSYITWTDTRNGENSVYFDRVELAGPNTPMISGPSNGKINRNHDFTVTTTDPSGQDVSYFIDWGDGSDSGWLGPYSSGTGVTESHRWTEEGSFTVRAKAKNTEDIESGWSTLTFSATKNKPYINTPILNFLENHPHLFLILRQLMELNIGFMN